MAVLVLAGLLAYTSSFDGAFVLDDLVHIVDNPRLAEGGPIAALADSRPLTSLSLWFNHALDRALGGDGLDPLGYHLFNLAVHLITGLTLFSVARPSLHAQGPHATWIAFAIALLWLVHPLGTQAVTYIIQRGESMMAMFFLLSIYCMGRGANGGRTPWYIAAIVAAWLSCMSKQVAVVLPVVMLLYDRAFLAGTVAAALRRRGWVYALITVGPLVLIASAGLGAGEDASAGFTMQRISPIAYALTQPAVILHYLRQVVWPVPLVFDYDWPVAARVGDVAVPLAAVLALVMAAGVALWRWPGVGFAAASFFLVLAPTSSIMPIADPAVEHRMYLPLAAVITLIVLGVAWALHRFAARRWLPIGAVLLAAATFALGGLTWARNQTYHDPADLWHDTITKRPHNSRAHHNLANVLFSRGDIDESIPWYRQAIALEPDDAQAHVNFGIALLQTGRPEAARQQFEQALTAAPAFAPAMNQLGILHARAGEHEAAAQRFRQAIASDPRYVDAYIHLGHVHFAREASAQAVEAYQAALDLRPAGPAVAQVHNNLGVSLARIGRLTDAAHHFARAVQLDPDFADAQANLRQAREMLQQPSP